jgi:hypothetical protein
MIGQLLDAAGQDGDLHFRGAGIRIMAMIVRDQFCLNFFRERHDVCFPFLNYAAPFPTNRTPHFGVSSFQKSSGPAEREVEQM